MSEQNRIRNDVVFVLGDGDRIRSHIERKLFSGELDSLSLFSKQLSAAVCNAAQAAQDLLSANVIMAGGDDILFSTAPEMFSVATLEGISRQFCNETGCTISFGVANDLWRAYLSLRIAKANGGELS